MFISDKQHKEAIGTFTNGLQKIYYTKMYKLYKPMAIPSVGEWLNTHKEAHQSYNCYKQPYYNPVTPARKTIYIQQFGNFNADFIRQLINFCKVFYLGLDVKALPIIDFQKELGNIKNRQNYYGKQYLAQDILAYMEKRVPKDAYCVMGITLKDLYPGQSWNYVYGWAKYKARVGIFSFVRWDDDFACGQNPQINWKKILYPSIRTMVHQIGHMFGVTHCVYNNCLMNGFNCIEENYNKPLEFCPVCYRKIVKNIGFKLSQRHRQLVMYCQQSGLKELKKDELIYQELLKLDDEYQGKSPDFKKTKVNELPKLRNNFVSTAKKFFNQTRGKSVATKVAMWK